MLIHPGIENCLRFPAEKLFHGHAPRVQRELQFIVNKSVIEARGGGVSSSAGVEDSSGSRPIDCAEAHGARLASSVEIAAGELKIAEDVAGFANGDDFGMGRGVVCGGDTICAFGDDAAVLYNDSSERPSPASADILEAKRDSAAHEFCGHFRC